MTGGPEAVGRYRIERLIAHGGMGSLYLARDPAIDRPVVIKFLKDGFDDPVARERFAREARAAGRLHHPNIVTVYDVGEHQDRPFIAMEYVAGETLAQLVARRAVRRLWEKLAIIEDICAGLHYAHSAAIVHRDIKPSNVMRDQSGVVKILDFGIAHGAGGAVTQAGDIVGTLNYMSPEQLAGESVDHRTDIYSVGLLAYELVTNQMAFPGTVQTGVLFKILNASPIPVESLVPGIDPDVPAMIDRAIARDPDERYPDLETLRQDLAIVRSRLLEASDDEEIDDAADPNAETRFVSPRITSAIQPGSSSRNRSALGSSGRPGTALRSARANTVASRRRRMRLVGMVAAVLVGLGALWMFFGSPGSTPSVSGVVSSPSGAASAAAPATQGDAERKEGPASATAGQVRAARVTARQQIDAGRDEDALDTLIRGLTHDPKDAELNRLVEEITGDARRALTTARNAAGVRGARAASSAAFREGQEKERESDKLLQTGDKVPGIRAAWAAAALYRRSPEAAHRSTTAGRAVSPAPPAVDAPKGPVPPAATGPVPIPASSESLSTLPGRANKPPDAPVTPPPAPKAPPPREPAPDPRAVEQAAIRETLRRYAQAYQSLDASAVARMMPSLTEEQVRATERDFADLRRYTVEIKDPQIVVDGQSATVTCEVVRSFEPKAGVRGSHSVESVFHLRRTGSGWIIERLESR